MGLFNALNRLYMTSIFARTPVDVEEVRRRKLFTAFVLVVLVPLLVFGTIHITGRDTMYGIIIYCVVLVLVITLVVVRFLRYGKQVYRVAMLSLFLLMTSWLYIGTIGGYGSLWVLASAPFAFFLMGKREASVWTMLMGLVSAAIFINPYSIIPSFRYQPDYAVRHLSVYVLISLITWYYESVREKYKIAMEAEQAKLVREKELLDRARKEVEQVNILLKGEMEVRKSAEENVRKHRDNLEKIVAERTAEIQKKNIELEAGEKRYRLLADNVNDVIWSADLNLSFTYVSPSISRLLGYSIDEAVKHNFESLLPPESLQKVARVYEEQMKLEREGTADPDRHVTMQLQHCRKDGTVVDVEITVTFMRGHDGRPVGIVGVTRDIGERVREQKEKEKMQQQLAQAQKMEAIGTLVAGIAHDFNNFLGGILGSLDLLGRTLKKENIKDREAVESYLQIGMDGSRRSADLIRQLIAISRKHEILLSPVDIHASLKHIQELCRNSFPKSIELDFSACEGPLMIMGDMVQVDQVLLNICINASHAMTTMRPAGSKQGGTLSVRADRVRSEEFLSEIRADAGNASDSWVRIRISDNGIGMNEEVKKRIFEPFFSMNKEMGTGLGLSTSYNIVQKHGGRIEVYSKPGAGSTFSVYIPAYDEGRGGDAVHAAQGDIVRGSGTVLIIDDEYSILHVVKGFLEQCGYTVLCGHGADEGTGIFRSSHVGISAVIIDYSMPGKSGLEVFQELKEIDPGIRAILSSGMIDGETRSLALRMGMKDTISKPFLARELSVKIRALAG